jgi:arsenate reductase (thioredoxin)
VTPRPERPIVLFVCVHNAGRSQMAAALLQTISDGGVDVRSAGSAPADELNPVVVQAMAELGIDLRAGGARPRLLTPAAAEQADVVVTMGCGDACPYYPGQRHLDWELDDPAGQPLEEVRLIRDEIATRVRVLADELADAG